MSEPITFSVMRLLHEQKCQLSSGQIARRLHISADRVQGQIPKLVKRGLVTRSAPRGGGYFLYSCDDAQWRAFIGHCRRPDALMIATQADDVISRKLKFLKMLKSSIHSDNPVLGEIMGDYESLRRKQSEAEGA
ncbi:MarR family transcriptional regulator [Paraburkholderia fungorum]|uniref:MarR family transcriptional regulator n=1 Tax=Paraburkholderia fungorum TaxID=134537 RepID=UPI0038B88408